VDRPYSRLPKLEEEPLIFLATPLAKDKLLNVETANFCSVVSKNPRVAWGRICMGSPELSRNSLIEDHLHSGLPWSHIMFLDSDIVPPMYALNKLLELDADFATAISPVLLKEGVYWNVTDKNDNMIPRSMPIEQRPFETQSCGAGCMLIRKEVLDEMEWPYFKMEYQPKWGDGNAVARGEDIYFSQKAKALGFKIIAEPRIQCEHYNQVGLLELYKILENQIKTGKVKIEKA